MRLTDLTEKRRNPERNPRTRINDALALYKDDPSISISFTDAMPIREFIDPEGRPKTTTAKLGINPRPRWGSTPSAIYGYPLHMVWDTIATRGTAQLPYAGHRPFVWVYSHNGTGKYIDKISEYSEADYAADVERLGEYIRAHEAANPAADGKPEQFLQFYTKPNLDPPLHHTPFGKFYKLTDFLAGVLSGRRKPMFKWNRMLREIGYAGFCDDGTNTIHPYEPIQTLFLSKSFITVHELLENK